jgi:hypothetical protein
MHARRALLPSYGVEAGSEALASRCSPHERKTGAARHPSLSPCSHSGRVATPTGFECETPVTSEPAQAEHRANEPYAPDEPSPSPARKCTERAPGSDTGSKILYALTVLLDAARGRQDWAEVAELGAKIVEEQKRAAPANVVTLDSRRGRGR